MSQDNLITLKHEGEHEVMDKATGKMVKKKVKAYIETSKNKKKLANAPKLTLKKYLKSVKKHVVFTETKKPYKK